VNPALKDDFDVKAERAVFEAGNAIADINYLYGVEVEHAEYWTEAMIRIIKGLYAQGVNDSIELMRTHGRTR
jgi:hypothetical protein